MFSQRSRCAFAHIGEGHYRIHNSCHATLYGHVHRPLNLLLQVRRRLKLGIHETNTAVLFFLFPLLRFCTFLIFDKNSIPISVSDELAEAS
jgi:hypothetical protein